jgi:ferredoxin-type protein NapH
MIAVRRGWVQLGSTILANSGLFPALKCVNYPFLNCYSCPLAIGACPVGTIQHFVIIRRVPLLVIGVLGIVGSIWGRMSCAWLCPFGYIQDLLYRLPWPGRKLTVDTRRYGWVKYVVLAVLFLAIPFVTLEPWFCKLCPAGTLQAGLPWLALSPTLGGLIGWFFWLKIALLLLFVLAAMSLSRVFCRFACPLGAAYGLSNRWSRSRIEVGGRNCGDCRRCAATCPMGLRPPTDANSTDCIRCEECVRLCEHLKVSRPQTRRSRPAGGGSSGQGEGRLGAAKEDVVFTRG